MPRDLCLQGGDGGDSGVIEKVPVVECRRQPPKNVQLLSIPSSFHV